MKISTYNIKIINFYIILLLILNIFTVSAASLQLGNMSYARAPAATLTRPASRSAGFFRAVGGVAFEAIAIGKGDTFVYDMEYDSSKPDGSRLIVSIADKQGEKRKITADIYDWELGPISEFSNSNNESAMTLFGNLLDEDKSDKAQEIREAGGRIINYHPAFDNTLVGLRLFQADVLIFQPNAVDLFKYKGNKEYILGAGEDNPNIESNRGKFLEMQDWLYEQRIQGNNYQSYVVGDIGQDVTFEIIENKLKFKGKPYWWMWDNSDQVEQDYNLFDMLQVYSELSKDSDNLSEEENMLLVQSIQIISEKVDSENDFKLLLDRIKSYGDGNAPVKPLNKFSDNVSKKVKELGGINPTIYNLVSKVMNYSALLKHFKQNSLEKYNAFLTKTKKIKVLPEVETPTIQYNELKSN